MLEKEQKKRQADQKKLNQAAEKQGRVGDVFGIDLAKLQVRTLEALASPNGIDWQKPFVMKIDESLPKVQAAMNDSSVTAALQSFYSGFPGSAAALQGSKRFTTPLKETQGLPADILQELGMTVDPDPEGSLFRVKSSSCGCCCCCCCALGMIAAEAAKARRCTMLYVDSRPGRMGRTWSPRS